MKSLHIWLIGLFGALLFALSFAVVTVAFYTLWTNHPLSSSDDSAEIFSNDDYTMFVYRRKLTVTREFFGHVDRFVIHGPTGRNITLPDSSQVYRPMADKQIERVFYLPPGLPKGEWCLHATLMYQPTFSLQQHIYEAAPVCATLK